jgi:hypothetical protein
MVICDFRLHVFKSFREVVRFDEVLQAPSGIKKFEPYQMGVFT